MNITNYSSVKNDILLNKLAPLMPVIHSLFVRDIVTTKLYYNFYNTLQNNDGQPARRKCSQFGDNAMKLQAFYLVTSCETVLFGSNHQIKKIKNRKILMYVTGFGNSRLTHLEIFFRCQLL